MLKKFKIKRYWKPLIAFSLVVTVIAVLSAFFTLAQAFKLLADIVTWSSFSSHFFFIQIKIHVIVIYRSIYIV